MIELWTVYDHPRNLALFAAVRSVIFAPDELAEHHDQVEHIKVSSDLHAIRRQLRIAGFWCCGRHPLDVPEIIEVWLKRYTAHTTYRQVRIRFATQKTARSH